MAEYISKEEAIKAIRYKFENPSRDMEWGMGTVDECEDILNALPVIEGRDAPPLKRGDMWFCPQCKHACSTTQNYCHKCGIKFDWSEAKNG